MPALLNLVLDRGSLLCKFSQVLGACSWRSTVPCTADVVGLTGLCGWCAAAVQVGRRCEHRHLRGAVWGHRQAHTASHGPAGGGYFEGHSGPPVRHHALLWRGCHCPQVHLPCLPQSWLAACHLSCSPTSRLLWHCRCHLLSTSQTCCVQALRTADHAASRCTGSTAQYLSLLGPYVKRSSPSVTRTAGRPH